MFEAFSYFMLKIIKRDVVIIIILDSIYTTISSCQIVICSHFEVCSVYMYIWQQL